MIEKLGAALASALPAVVTETCPTCGHSTTTGLWLMVGFLGQAVFTARFLAQWLASERRRDSVVPVVFWWLSMAGGLILLSYALHRRDPVIVVGQGMGIFIYVRNLMLVAKGRRRDAKRKERERAAVIAAEPIVEANQPLEPDPRPSVIPRPHLVDGRPSDNRPAA